ncbi:hypothetical protein ACQUQP_13100 [Marinobacterium sp. YM272]|uniref:hypothetical protein n=1 Tax=Marinobacterium sp. YM272 TaxID=3421654 RepID=UPI003D7FDD09
MEKRYRRMLLNHRLIKQDEAEQERLQSSGASEDTQDRSADTRSKEMNRKRTWRRLKPAFHTIEGYPVEIHITLWDEIEN